MDILLLGWVEVAPDDNVSYMTSYVTCKYITLLQVVKKFPKVLDKCQNRMITANSSICTTESGQAKASL